MDPSLLARALADRARTGRLPRAVIVVHLYGQCADIDAIAELCGRYDVTLIEDAAEALGATYFRRKDGPEGARRRVSPGTIGLLGIFSFNSNVLIQFFCLT